jgi:hypothetical protein
MGSAGAKALRFKKEPGSRKSEAATVAGGEVR